MKHFQENKVAAASTILLPQMVAMILLLGDIKTLLSGRGRIQHLMELITTN